ncbi:MAG: peptidase M23 [uncultured bacterium (gcode 4)]|uniref:Peptidase M23 n=1 Tax=uncultured bacterium (gcode 4) TaxID=1234023 RepID=K2AFK6_9BACT|nr:MAG: peptidase M23 [uncultured bacterium (gcode 4)]
MNSNFKNLSILKKIWLFNLILALFYFSTFYGVRYFKSSILEYSNIVSDPFDGTVSPISYVPNWLKSKNTNKSLNFQEDVFWVDDFIEIPKYDLNNLQNSDTRNKEALLARYTYPVLYMGSYRLNYEEYEWSHPAVDIRAPIGTPVLSIANWVVIKVKNTVSWDWKYVVIRHDNINYNWTVQSLYSSYEHLSDIFAVEWTKIKKWDVLWKVGMTWITTTPHLHFQIDKKASPFHPYWPFSFADAKTLGLDFFWAINVWLGKENAMELTIHPMEFVQNNITKISLLNSAPIEQVNNSNIVKTQIQENKQDTPKSLSVEKIPTSAQTDTGLLNNLNTWITENSAPVKAPESIIKPKLEDGQIFYDIPKNSKFFQATKYLYDNSISKWYETWNFGINNSVSRWEALIFILKLYKINLDSTTQISFSDISSDSFLAPYLKKSIDLWFITAKNKNFRPDDQITRAEFITILIKASQKELVKTTSTQNWTNFSDIKPTNWFTPYAYTFRNSFPSSSGDNKFEPNKSFSRGQIALILYSFSKK